MSDTSGAAAVVSVGRTLANPKSLHQNRSVQCHFQGGRGRLTFALIRGAQLGFCFRLLCLPLLADGGIGFRE